MTELNVLEWELGGLLLKVAGDGDTGLDDLPELEGSDEASGGDGVTAGLQRMASREITIAINLSPGDPAINQDPAAFSAQLDAIRKVMSPLPNRSELRLFRFRRDGEVTKRLWVKPAGMTVPADMSRLKLAGSDRIVLRLEAPDPVIRSDALHSATFTAGETKTIVNAGTLTAWHPTAWALTCSAAGGVVVTNTDFDETVKFPKGPVTVNEQRECVTADTYGIVYGPGSRLFPQWPLLRPGDNHIKATAACTFTWRDTW